MIDHVADAADERASSETELLELENKRAATVDVDDVTMLLRELRLVEQLRRAAR